MIVPQPQPFSSIQAGSVFVAGGVDYYIKCDATTACNLLTGTIASAIPPENPYVLLPAAKLVLG